MRYKPANPFCPMMDKPFTLALPTTTFMPLTWPTVHQNGARYGSQRRVCRSRGLGREHLRSLTNRNAYKVQDNGNGVAPTQLWVNNFTLPGWYFSNKQWSIPALSNDESVLYLGDGNGNIAALNTTLGRTTGVARSGSGKDSRPLRRRSERQRLLHFDRSQSLCFCGQRNHCNSVGKLSGRWIELHPPVSRRQCIQSSGLHLK